LALSTLKAGEPRTTKNKHTLHFDNKFNKLKTLLNEFTKGKNGNFMGKLNLDSLLKYMDSTYLKLWYNHTLPILQSKGVNENDDFRISEKSVQMIWNKQSYNNDELVDDQGKKYTILKPGTWNREPGPDFKNATITIDQQQLHGDIEIHLKPENWLQHGHQFDPAYNNVILHIVWENPKSKRIPENIPVIELSSQLIIAEDKIWELQSPDSYSKNQIHPPVECAQQMNLISDDVLQYTFRAAGLSRLQRKVNSIKLLSSKYGFNQALYTLLADAMGYKSNRQPFRQLSLNVSLEQLHGLSELQRKALLWGSSGLLPDYSQAEVHPELLNECKELWDVWWALRQEKDQPRPNWKRSSLRPTNSPERRISALLNILEKCDFQPEIYIEAAIHLLKQGQSPRKYFEQVFAISDPWSKFCNYKTKLTKELKLIGKSRQMDIIINVFIPAMIAKIDESSEEPLLHDIYRFYCSLPKSQDNHTLDIARHRFFIPPARMKSVITKAVDQQGVMQLMHDFDLPQTPKDIIDFWQELGIDLEMVN
jgi:hypothetical protein